MKKELLKKNWKYLIVLLLVCIPLFQHLGTFTLRVYDESRLAINAYEMYHSGNFLIPTYDGEPDMWNTKPPLMIWLQVLSMKIFGINEFATRLPAAMAALFTCILLLILSVRYLKNFWFGCIAVLVLITSPGFVYLHTSRTGDYDALLTLLLTLSSFTLLAFLENPKKKYLYCFFISLALAVLTKSSAALLIIPGFFIYVVVRKKMLFLLKNPHFYVGLIVFLALGCGYYFLREIYNPGYIQAVWENELGGRFLETIEAHKHGFWYYYENLINDRYKVWIFLIPCGIITAIFCKDKKNKNLALFSSIIAISYFLIISLAQTKLYWYDMPLYPFFAMLAGIFIYFIFSFLKENRKISHTLKYNVTPYIFVILVFIIPYIQILKVTYTQKENLWDEEFYGISYYLRDIIKEKREGENFTIVYAGYPPHIIFYINILNEKDRNIVLKRKDEIKIGENILISQNEIKEYLEEKYDFNIIEETNYTKMFEILKEK